MSTTQTPSSIVVVIECWECPANQPLQGASGKTYGVFQRDLARTEVGRKRGERRGIVSSVRMPLDKWRAVAKDICTHKRQKIVVDIEIEGEIEKANEEFAMVQNFRTQRLALEQEVNKAREDLKHYALRKEQIEELLNAEPPEEETPVATIEEAPAAPTPAPPKDPPKTAGGKTKKF